MSSELTRRDARGAPYRTMVLGLDGATFDVIDPLVARGRMPALAWVTFLTETA
jgi:hypothetical protein